MISQWGSLGIFPHAFMDFNYNYLTGMFIFNKNGQKATELS